MQKASARGRVYKEISSEQFDNGKRKCRQGEKKDVRYQNDVGYRRGTGTGKVRNQVSILFNDNAGIGLIPDRFDSFRWYRIRSLLEPAQVRYRKSTKPGFDLVNDNTGIGLIPDRFDSFRRYRIRSLPRTRPSTMPVPV